MTQYNAFAYREYAVKFEGIEAASPEEAAVIAAGMDARLAVSVEDAEGGTTDVMIDRVGDSDFAESVTIKMDVTTGQPVPPVEPQPAVQRTGRFCARCGSENVTNDALARWCVTTQTWEIGGLLQSADCEHCSGECDIDERVIGEDGYPADHGLEASDYAQVKELVDRIIDAGYFISVYDGGEYCVQRCNDRHVVVSAMGSTDQDRLRIRPEGKQPIGDIVLVYGNEPGVLVADHTDNFEIGVLVDPSRKDERPTLL